MIDEKWIKELETTTRKQGKGQLYNRNNSSYCCLGIAAVKCLEYKAIEINNKELLKIEEAEALGLTTDQMRVLAFLNDGTLTFLDEGSDIKWFGRIQVQPHTFKEIAAILRDYNREHFNAGD